MAILKTDKSKKVGGSRSKGSAATKQSVAKAPRGRSQAQVSAQHRADRNR